MFLIFNGDEPNKSERNIRHFFSNNQIRDRIVSERQMDKEEYNLVDLDILQKCDTAAVSLLFSIWILKGLS